MSLFPRRSPDDVYALLVVTWIAAPVALIAVAAVAYFAGYGDARTEIRDRFVVSCLRDAPPDGPGAGAAARCQALFDRNFGVDR